MSVPEERDRVIRFVATMLDVDSDLLCDERFVRMVRVIYEVESEYEAFLRTGEVLPMPDASEVGF